MLNMMKTHGKMTPTINIEDFKTLVDRYAIVPKIIETEAEYEHFVTIAESLSFKETSESETKLLMLLVKLIEDYEEETGSISEWVGTLKPHEFLQELIEAKNIKQIELAREVGIDAGMLSGMVNGKRAISNAQAKKLGAYFKIPFSSFL
jgi:HTH-type transcriptional regulator / antitoxin HigA